jgi:hypothetical protein
MEITIIIMILVVFILWIFLILKFSKRKKLTSTQKSFILKNYKKISKNDDIKHQIVDFDKLYHKILLELGYKWSFWEILKQKPRVINDINKIWELHKLRNKLVHEFDSLSESVLKQKAEEYDKVVMNLIKDI